MLARFQNHNNVPMARCETRCGRARPQCWWATAGPGRASRRRAERRSRRGRRAGGPPPTGTHSGLNEHQQHWKRRRCGGYRRFRQGLAAVLVGGGRAWPGFETTRRASAALQAPPVWRVPSGPEGTGGLRDRSLRAKLACGDLAGGRTRRRPEQQRRHKQHSTGARTRRPAPLDATTPTQLRSTCVRCRSARAAHRSRRSSRSPRLRRRAGPRR